MLPRTATPAQGSLATPVVRCRHCRRPLKGKAAANGAGDVCRRKYEGQVLAVAAPVAVTPAPAPIPQLTVAELDQVSALAAAGTPYRAAVVEVLGYRLALQIAKIPTPPPAVDLPIDFVERARARDEARATTQLELAQLR